MKKLVDRLKAVGKTTRTYKTRDGTRLLILPHGGRMLGLYSNRSDENFYWTNDALASVKSARAFYAGEQWHNSGGDRTWLAPEVDLFFPMFPKLDKYFQQRSIDPGNFEVRKAGSSIKLVNRLAVSFSRTKEKINLIITKSFSTAENPLRHERGVDYGKVEYAGYTQYTKLELTGSTKSAKVQVGLWNLVQMPHGGDLLIPTYSYSKPRHIFSTIGSISDADLRIDDHLIRYKMRQKGEHKISARAVSVCGRIGYIYKSGPKWSLIIRNFVVNPSGAYVDVPWNDTKYFGFAVQACNVNSPLGTFSELEYHIPAIGYDTGRLKCYDEAQVWAFRGEKDSIERIQKLLLGVRSR